MAGEGRTAEGRAICFACGARVKEDPLEAPPRLPDGSRCPACLDRFLDAQPPLLPRVASEEPAPEGDPAGGPNLGA